MENVKMSPQQSASLVSVTRDTIYTFTNYEIAQSYRNQLGDDARLVSPDFGVYQVVTTELLVKQ